MNGGCNDGAQHPNRVRAEGKGILHLRPEASSTQSGLGHDLPQVEANKAAVGVLMRAFAALLQATATKDRSRERGSMEGADGPRL